MNTNTTILITVDTGKEGSEVHTSFVIDKEDWELKTTEERDELCMDYILQLINWNYVERGE